MSLCEFTYTPAAKGYEAKCARCGRCVNTKGKSVYAACASSDDYSQTHARISGLVKGPGTILSEMLRRLFGISADARCPCKKHALVMDMHGPDWCEANVEQIVGWLREEATKRGLPFVDLAGRMIVRRAIKNARRAALDAPATLTAWHAADAASYHRKKQP